MNNNNFISDDLFNNMFGDQKIRAAITKESHMYFFHFYFAHYVKYATAAFQREIFELTEGKENFYVVACRGSGKSTIVTTSYSLWAILGKQQKKFVLIICQTKAQAKQVMLNLRREVESNRLLKNDLGPFQEEEAEEWGANSIVFSELNARVTVVSSEQSIRGLRHGAHRPDLIICDDIEDLASTKTQESRDKTYQWLKGEVIPIGDIGTKLVIVGNLLHEDSLLMRIKQGVAEKTFSGIFKEYPLLDAENKILWPGKYPTMEDIEIERQKIGSEVAWQREYLLRILPEYDQVIHRDWIKYYDVMPKKRHLVDIRIGVDLAISEKSTADYTAMVTGYIFEDPDTWKYTLYIDSFVVNKRMTFPETVATCDELHQKYKDSQYPTFIIESVAYQQALPQLLEQKGLSARGMRIGSMDKRSRLNIASSRIKSGEILFPRQGCEKLIDQIVNFGTERYDDMADAFTMLILDIINDMPSVPRILVIGGNSRIPDGPPDFGGRWTPLL